MMFFVTLIASSRMMPSITRLSFDEFLDAKQYEFELHDARVQRLGGYPREFGQRIDDFGVFRGYFAIVSIARRGQVRRRESSSRTTSRCSCSLEISTTAREISKEQEHQIGRAHV